jgi:hypothetical protein
LSFVPTLPELVAVEELLVPAAAELLAVAVRLVPASAELLAVAAGLVPATAELLAVAAGLVLASAELLVAAELVRLGVWFVRGIADGLVRPRLATWSIARPGPIKAILIGARGP